MGYPTKVQLIQRDAGKQWYVNFPSALAHVFPEWPGDTILFRRHSMLISYALNVSFSFQRCSLAATYQRLPERTTLIVRIRQSSGKKYLRLQLVKRTASESKLSVLSFGRRPGRIVRFVW